MMKYFMFLVFMIPIVKNWWIFMLCFMFFFMLMLSNSINIFYGMISYSYGMDMLSYWMILLTMWIMPLMIMASYKIKMLKSVMEFLLILLMLSLFLILSFSTSNLFMFYFWFECSMIPTVILIFGWGYQPERLMAGMYLIFYTLFASLPMLISIFYLFYKNKSLFMFMINIDFNIYIYLSLIMAFLVKMPMFLFHFWLPKAHVEAPVSGSMILAGVLLKLGGYGLFRVFNFMYMYIEYNYLWIVLSLFGSVIIGLLCMCQIDIKSMIAYSSVSHMGMVISGMMTCNSFGLWGSLIMMLGHGLCSSALFSLANLMYEHSGSRSIMINKGFMIFMPTISMFWFMLSINNMSSPPSLGLLGEIMLINSLMGWSMMTFIFLGLSSFFSCCYSIYMFSITQHGSIYSGLKYSCYGNIREIMMIMLHWLPLNMLFLKSDIFTFWV
uniref:NADH dehydrogenase subunit 4 n=1 Tax=Iphicrates gressitti TaxID=2969360 RepID=UPI002176D2DB|nr:NADH dehydrogenase subunit 4 [Iphicrates gressitti]UUJ37772.1 NADH dehydrogenase subunit 4 [Iphicrates gressitti]